MKRAEWEIAEKETPRGPGLLAAAELEGMDFAAGLSRYGSEAAYLRVLRSYAIHTPAFIEQMRRVEGGKLAEYGVAAHGLKGSSFGAEAKAVGQMAARLERAAKKGDLAAVLAENGKTIEAAESLLAGLNALLSRAFRENGPKERAQKPDRALLEKIRSAAEHYRGGALEDLMEELRRYEYESGSDLIPWLRERLDNLEYDAIVERLRRELEQDR
ncbi:MAG: hypothetical protein LBR61_11330 [Synergistaceae bacterium]|jgi:HPt (histidine-containing phosphotransfer) domain-containing protein|nr:hypothetical protein [Synergistaceae bacterium]